MFFKLILENQYGDQIDMTTTANQYMTSKVEGLSPPPGTVSTSGYAGMDGSYLNNAFIEKRNVVISFEMRGVDIKKRRHQLYKVVKPSRYIKIYYKTAGIDVYTEGFVETCEVDSFEELTTGQISILCPDIYWYSVFQEIVDYSLIRGVFTFPFPYERNPDPFVLGQYNYDRMLVIENAGDETGFILQIEGVSKDEVAARSPTIYNADTDEYLQIKGDILHGDIITITTKTGNKSITLERGGVKENIINRLVSGSTWFMQREGKNRFYLRGTGLNNLKVKLIHTNAYLGV